MKIGDQEYGLSKYFSDDHEFSNQLREGGLEAIIHAYKHHRRMESLANNSGARTLSPALLAQAHYHRTVNQVLQHVLDMLCTEESEWTINHFYDEVVHGDCPDISLILKEENKR